MRYIPNRALTVSGAALVTAAAMLLFSTSPAAAAKPQVTITAGPTVNADDSVSLTYSINRWPRAIASRVCTVDTATSHTCVGCGALPQAPRQPDRRLGDRHRAGRRDLHVHGQGQPHGGRHARPPRHRSPPRPDPSAPAGTTR